jgi:hypothetical protein
MTLTTGYHHFMNNDDASAAVLAGPLGDASDTNRNCLLCHVDHDVFSPELNAQSLGRSHNLRVSVATAPTQSPTTFTNTDFVAGAGDGGICLSCHKDVQTRSFSVATGGTSVLSVDRGDYEACVHHYTAVSSFSSDASTFLANCAKCHDDGRTRVFQSGTPTFGLHNGLYAELLAPLGSSFIPTDPPTSVFPNLLEEDFCFQCHGASSSYTTGTGTGFFGAAVMSSRARNVFAALSDAALTQQHPILLYRDRHRPSAGNTTPDAPDDLEGTPHAECMDCHNPHRARAGVMAATGNDVQGVLRGVWGIEPTFTSGTTAPTGFTVLPTALKEYNVCLKCHTAYIGAGTTDRMAEELSPENGSFHPVLAAGTNPGMPLGLLDPWYSATNRRMSCSHCHGNSKTGADDPRGPHASANAHILKKPYRTVFGLQPAGDLCFDCHDYHTYTNQGSPPSGYTSSWTNFRSGSDNLHQRPGAHRIIGCRACHVTHGSPQTGLITLYNAGQDPLSRIITFTPATPGNYTKASCGVRTGGGCHH